MASVSPAPANGIDTIARLPSDHPGIAAGRNGRKSGDSARGSTVMHPPPAAITDSATMLQANHAMRRVGSVSSLASRLSMTLGFGGGAQHIKGAARALSPEEEAAIAAAQAELRNISVEDLFFYSRWKDPSGWGHVVFLVLYGPIGLCLLPVTQRFCRAFSQIAG